MANRSSRSQPEDDREMDDDAVRGLVEDEPEETDEEFEEDEELTDDENEEEA